MNAALLPDTLESASPRISSAVKMARNIERNSQKLNDIIHALRDLFVRRDNTYRTPIAINQVVSDAVRHLQEEQKLSGMVIQVEGRDQSAWVNGDRQQLIQVFKNLIDNAAYANRIKNKNDILVTISSENSQIEISVIDQGTGIDDSIRSKIFEPYFSTKGNEGTGMGLHICKQIIESHGGTIHFEEGFKSGAKIVLILPQFPS
jgi:signal transduction histidine kinase